jgi:hypothetical protein
MIGTKIEKITILEPVEQPEILSLPPEEIEQILAKDIAKPKRPPDPCLLEDSSEDYDEEPVTEYQDSMDAAGYPYW